MTDEAPERGRLLVFPRASTAGPPPEAGGLPQFGIWRTGLLVSMTLPLFDLFLLHLSEGPPESRALLTELEMVIYPERHPPPDLPRPG